MITLMIHQDDIQSWNELVEAIKAGQVPQVSSKKRQRAILAIASYLESNADWLKLIQSQPKKKKSSLKLKSTAISKIIQEYRANGLTSKELAKRLDISEILLLNKFQNLDTSNFALFTQSKDPEGHAWCFDEATENFTQVK